MSGPLTEDDARRLEECVASGGVAVFPTDTVYGVCCDPEDEGAAERLYRLKGRPASRPAAVMFFAIEPALEMLGEIPEPEEDALQALLPGPVTVLLANRARRFAPACRLDPSTLGLRVPRLPERLAALAAIASPVMQTSANLSGEPDAHTLEEVPRRILEGAELVIDGGELDATPSTVVDLRDFFAHRRWHVLREGALPTVSVEERLAPLG
ncbi:MAG TPA: L-threonylcarbamoyladenylate synthase [Solirubrobacteraceae bacterium]|jgi:L-threonylcarbamoyladenylate synthase